eukprot:scaffold655_cov379-Prasinococcus_capsulatus_cf.AAC.24
MHSSRNGLGCGRARTLCTDSCGAASNLGSANTVRKVSGGNSRREWRNRDKSNVNAFQLEVSKRSNVLHCTQDPTYLQYSTW